MSRIWIVRHGNTFEDGEPARRIGASTDIPLVESGRRQGEALSRWFAVNGISFDRVLAGPLLRTRETARLITANASPELCDWLAEIDHGPDEDRTEADVVARIGAEALAAWDRDAVPPPDWRTDADLRIAGWRALLDEAGEGEEVLAVTSNGAARFVFMAGAERTKVGDSLKLRTGAWGLISRLPGGGWQAAEWDRRP